MRQSVLPEVPIRRASSQSSAPCDSGMFVRHRAVGKFLFCDREKFHVRGVTYGTFRSDESGNELLDPGTVDRDFRLMTRHGFNAIRTYTVPPEWLLDLAESHGLRLLVGLPWQEHVAFLDSRATRRSIEHRLRTMMSACAGHPAILAYAVGNEIPASVVRWHG